MRKIETRFLSNEELKCLYILKQVANTFEFNKELVIGDTHMESVTTIFKYGRKGMWVVMDKYLKNDNYVLGIFNNCYDACIKVIKSFIADFTYENGYTYERLNEKTFHAIKCFNSILRDELDDKELIKFATKYHFVDEFFYQDLIYRIKKSNDESIDRDETANERIMLRLDDELNAGRVGMFESEFQSFLKRLAIKVEEKPYALNYEEILDKEIKVLNNKGKIKKKHK